MNQHSISGNSYFSSFLDTRIRYSKIDLSSFPLPVDGCNPYLVLLVLLC